MRGNWHYVYILRSLRDNKFYTGSCSDLQSRIARHNKGLVEATKSRRPLELIYYEVCLNRRDSINREVYLKTAWGKRYIKNRLKYYLSKKVPVR